MRFRPRTAAGVSIALLLLAPHRDVTAEGAPQQADPRTAGWVFTPSLAVGGGWDDNVLLVNPQNNPPRDYASPINPSATIDFTGRRTQFSSSYNGSFTFYRRIEELTSFEHSLHASLRHRLTPRVSLFADESFSRAPTTDALELAGIPFYRVGSRTNAFGGGAEALLTRYTSLRARYALRTVGFDFDELAQRELLGGHAQDLELSVSRGLSARMTVRAQYGLLLGTVGQVARNTNVTPDVAPAQPTAALTADRQFNIQNGAISATYRLSPHVNVSGGVGVARLGGTLTQTAAIGPTFHGGASWQAEHSLASVAYQRSFIPSFGFGGTFQNEEWIASLHVPFARNRAYADTNLAWFSNDPLIEDQPSLRSVRLSGRVGYRVTRWLSVEGYSARAQQNSARAGGQLSRNQIGFQVVTSRPMRLQ
ncbi:MAG: hypothetical protein H0W08_02375 [Acidobacteria bacterium]|nr:hypothetical protein [Acidobacteriota bacterium]